MNELKLRAIEVGFEASLVEDLIANYGEKVLELLIELVSAGFSTAWISNVIQVLGPAVLEVLARLLKQPQGLMTVPMLDEKKLTSAVQILEGERVDSFSSGLGLLDLIKLLPTILPLIQQLGPMLPQLLEAFKIISALFAKK